METIEGTLEQIIFENKETGYIVARLSLTSHKSQLITFVGKFSALSIGEQLVLKGLWSVHPKYGRQFEVKEYITVLPATEAGIQKYLSSGLVKGIGPALSARIIKHFGKDTLRIIDEQPSRLEEVEGIGPSRSKSITQARDEQKEIRDVMLFLKTYDISTNYAIKIFKTYGREAIKIIQENPYQLAEDIFGIGFKKADQIALKLGIAPDAPTRIGSALIYTLSEAANQGHTFLPNSELFDRCVKLLGVEVIKDTLPISQILHQLARQKRVVIEDQKIGTEGQDTHRGSVYLPHLYYSELGVALRLKLIHSTPSRIGPEEAEKLLDRLKQKEAVEGHAYSTEQEEAIRAALLSKVMILTGGPGTGKTTTVKGIIQTMEWMGWNVPLAAPTGRAAKRLSEATGREAKTIHRMLGYQPPSEFWFNEDNPLEANAIIVDEVSMVDLILMHHLTKAIPAHANLILIGDADQLPSVGAGRVLHDLIESGEAHVIKLTKIFRQAQQSRIVVNAHRINQGELPYLDSSEEDNFFFVEEEDPLQAAKTIMQLVAYRLPGFYGWDAFKDIQVLSPMYRGITGVENLNHLLQQRLNLTEVLDIPGTNGRFRLGDKVMQLRNNYEKDVFNGDIGRIVDWDGATQQIKVGFPDRPQIPYDTADLNELTLAYAISIHKSQGSEYKAVVIPILPHHHVMLQRKLLYTAITRAKDLVVIVGSKKALGVAVSNDKQQLRYSQLASKLASRTPDNPREV